MARKTKEGAEETRAGILKAALSLFSSRGVSGTTLTEIAQKAGVTRGAIYWHFDNKDHLLHALWEQTVTPYEMIAQLGERLDEPDPLGRLHQLHLAILQDLAENDKTRQFFQIWLDRGKLGSVDRNESYLELEERRQRSLKKIEGIMRNAASKGQLPPNFDAHVGALALYTFVDGLVTALLLNPKSSAVKTDISRLLDAFFFMLRAGNNPYLSNRPEQGGGEE